MWAVVLMETSMGAILGSLCALKSTFPDDPDAEYQSIEATVLDRLDLAGGHDVQRGDAQRDNIERGARSASAGSHPGIANYDVFCAADGFGRGPAAGQASATTQGARSCGPPPFGLGGGTSQPRDDHLQPFIPAAEPPEKRQRTVETIHSYVELGGWEG